MAAPHDRVPADRVPTDRATVTSTTDVASGDRPGDRTFTSAETRNTSADAATARNAATWSYVPDADPGDMDLSGFAVEAEDGHVGKVERSSAGSGNAFIVVDTGPLLRNRKRLIPASKIRQVNPDADKVFVSLTQGQIDEAPDYEPTMQDDPVYRQLVVDHYAVIRR